MRLYFVNTNCNSSAFRFNQSDFAGSDIRPPEDNLEKTKRSFCKGGCGEVWIPCNGHKSQLVQLLHYSEVTLDISGHFVEFNANLTHVGERPAVMQFFKDKISNLCFETTKTPLEPLQHRITLGSFDIDLKRSRFSIFTVLYICPE